MSLSRSGSPSKGFAPVVHLDNLEILQDRWSKVAEGLKHPPLPPVLNSPRSLKACRLCSIAPDTDLEKLSLKQHLFRVLGDRKVDVAVAAVSAEAETKAAMQVAVLAFQRAAIGMGTGREKLVAYHAFTAQETQRTPRLANAREVRRELMAEEAFELRRRLHVEGSVEPSSLSVSGRSPGATAGSSRHRPQHSSRRSSAELSARGTYGHSPIPSTRSASNGGIAVPPDGDVTSSRRTRRSLSPSNLVGRPEAAYERYIYDESSRAQTDFCPSVSQDGYLPYVPRNATSLNTNYFGNRVVDQSVSNPSCTPLSRAMSLERGTGTRGSPQTEYGAASSLESVSIGGSAAKVDTRQQLPLSEKRPQRVATAKKTGGDPTPSPTSAPTAASGNDSMQVEHISPGGRNDLSIASINSSQLGWMLGASADKLHARVAGQRSSGAGPSRPQSTFSGVTAVNLFHQKDPRTAADGADGAASAAVPAPLPAPTVRERGHRQTRSAPRKKAPPTSPPLSVPPTPPPHFTEAPARVQVADTAVTVKPTKAAPHGGQATSVPAGSGSAQLATAARVGESRKLTPSPRKPAAAAPVAGEAVPTTVDESEPIFLYYANPSLTVFV